MTNIPVEACCWQIGYLCPHQHTLRETWKYRIEEGGEGRGEEGGGEEGGRRGRKEGEEERRDKRVQIEEEGEVRKRRERREKGVGGREGEMKQED